MKQNRVQAMVTELSAFRLPKGLEATVSLLVQQDSIEHDYYPRIIALGVEIDILTREEEKSLDQVYIRWADQPLLVRLGVVLLFSRIVCSFYMQRTRFKI